MFKIEKIKTYNLDSDKESRIRQITSIALVLYVFTLPLNGIEWNWFGVERFEFKITMVTFLFLFVAWLTMNIMFQKKRTTKQKLFYFLAFIYASSQFLSLINSPLPLESLKQAVIIVCYLTMMIVVSDTVSDRKTTLSVLTAMGGFSFIIAISGVITYYFINKGFSRLGESGTNLMGIINLGGDSYYFGDILLGSSGAVFFLILKNFQTRYVKYISIALLFLWFSAFILTYTKGLILAIVSFLLLSILLLKGKRLLTLLWLILFILAFIGNSNLTKIIKEKKVRQSKPIGELLSEQHRSYLPIGELFLREKRKPNLQPAQQHVFGYNFLFVRLKLIEVSLIKSIDYFWFGHGAGSSQILFPHMVYIDVNKLDGHFDHKTNVTVKNGLIGSHVLFITEFFNVGIFGTATLICLVLFVLIELYKVAKIRVRETDYIPSLLLITIIALLIFRLTASLITIPFLWFMLGFGFGVSQTYRLKWHD